MCIVGKEEEAGLEFCCHKPKGQWWCWLYGVLDSWLTEFVQNVVLLLLWSVGLARLKLHCAGPKWSLVGLGYKILACAGIYERTMSI